MATKLRRSLYIGLGGTGINTILRTKKMFMDNYGGKVPPMIAFLGVDTDKAAYDKTLHTKLGEIVKLEGNEKCSISVDNPNDIYQRRAKDGEINWMFDKNARAIRSLTDGAGQVRTNGRLAFHLNTPNIKATFNACIDKIRNVQIVHNELYEVLDSRLEVHLIYSVSGGTGAGTFIDAAYYLRSLLDNAVGEGKYKLAGYAVLPNVFLAMEPTGPAMARVRTNAYGAIKDLDYLMHVGKNNEDTVKMIWGRADSAEFSNAPFDSVFIVDNNNSNGQIFPHVNDLAEVMSLALISSSGEIASSASSVMDNVNIQMASGIFDVHDKLGWVSSIGASEIIYNSSAVASIYALKAGSRICNLLTTSNGEANVRANAWIDDVAIRENGGSQNDFLINYLYEMKNLVVLDEIDNAKNPKPEVENYIKQATNKDLQIKVDGKLTECTESLNKLALELLNSGKSGVALASETLKDISGQIDIFLGEMKGEQIELEDAKDTLDQAVNNAISELKDAANSGIIGRKGRVRDANEELCTRAKNLAANYLETSRRVNAISFFTSLKSVVSGLVTKIDELKARIENTSAQFDQAVIELQNNASAGTSIVEIDLSSEIATKVHVEDTEIIIGDFIGAIEDKNLFKLDSADKVKSAIHNFAVALPGTQLRKDKTVDDAINELSPEKFDSIFNQAITKAAPLLNINAKGYSNKDGEQLTQAANKMYYICVPNSATNRITRAADDSGEPYYKKIIGGPNPPAPISTGLSDKIIIYRVEGAYPAFSIGCLETFKTNYEQDNMSSHFDKPLLERMERELYDLYPHQDEAPDALESWVYGLIYDFIKVEDGVYMFKDFEDASRALNGYWIDTKERFRDRAFSMFSERISSIQEQYNAKIEEKIKLEGGAANDRLIADVKADNNYFNNYSKCPIKLETLQSRREYKPTLDLLVKELEFVNNI